MREGRREKQRKERERARANVRDNNRAMTKTQNRNVHDILEDNIYVVAPWDEISTHVN